MAKIVTLTPNPAIDLCTSVDRVVPTRKLRCTTQRCDPGGGGVNVARVVKRFGGDVEAVLPAGGITGQLLRRLIAGEEIPNRIIEAEADTREDFFVSDRSEDLQYRFILPGQPLREREWRACLAALTAVTPPPEFVVASGSLPPSVPNDFYGEVAGIAQKLGAKCLLDTSGAPLAAALEHSLYLIKPNLREMSDLIGTELVTQDDWLQAARAILARKKIEIIALSLGHLGALLVTRSGAFRAQALAIKPISAVGAGDSFLGALVFSLADGASLLDAFRNAAAAGAAALLNEGTELCNPADVYRLSREVSIEPV